MLDAYTVVQAQNALQLTDAQYGPFVTRLRKLQENRRRNNQIRNRLLQELRTMAAPNGNADENAMREKLRALREHNQQSAAALQRDSEAVDEVLDVRQQVRFRLLEERLERQKLDLLMRSRRRATSPTAPTGRSRAAAAGFTMNSWCPGPISPRLLSTLAVIGASVTLSARLTKQEADQFSAKLNRIVQTGNAKPVKTAKPVAAQPLTTQITDNELNAYFKYNAKEQIPVGIVEPTINALGEGRVTRARRRRSGRGAQAEAARLARSARLSDRPAADHRRGQAATTKEGVGRFQLESAEISGVTIPKTAAAGAPQLLLAHAGKSRRASTWTSRSSCRRASGRSASARRPRQSCNDASRAPIVSRRFDGPSLGTSIPERCRAAARRRSAARRAHAPSKICSTGFPPATRIAATSRPSRRCGRAWRRRSPAKSSAAASGRRAGRASRSSRCWCATSTGALRAVWFNQPFLNDVFHPHQRVILFGKLELTSHGLQMQSPQYEILRQEDERRRRGRRARSRRRRRRCTPAASCPIYEKTGTADRRRCSACSCTRRCSALPADAAGSAAARTCASGSS